MAFRTQDLRAEYGATVLMIEHDMSLVRRVADRVLALDNGRVVALGSFEAVQQHPDVVASYLGS
jgi:branched-chain amino acid transport system ATP-binding protein